MTRLKAHSPMKTAIPRWSATPIASATFLVDRPINMSGNESSHATVR
jgi:hypothetical protein